MVSVLGTKMANNEDNSSGNSNRATLLKTMYQKRDKEVRDSFKELSLWQEESQRQFSNIMHFHSNCIAKTIVELVKEVCDLQGQLSVTTKERDDLIESVRNLSEEIKLLNSNLSFPNPVETQYLRQVH